MASLLNHYRSPAQVRGYTQRMLRALVLVSGLLLLGIVVWWLDARREQREALLEPRRPATQEPSTDSSDVSTDVDKGGVERSESLLDPAAAMVIGEQELPPARTVVDVRTALARALEAERQGRLLVPPDDSAIGWYRAALALDPANVAAQQGLEGLVQRFVDEANIALDEGRTFEVFEVLPLLMALAPDAQGVVDLKARLELLRQVDDLLIAANEARARGVLRGRNSALGFLRQALAIDPTSREVDRALRELEAQHLGEAVAAATAGAWAGVDGHFQRADEVRPSSEEQSAARREVETLRARRRDQALVDARAKLAARQIADAQVAVRNYLELGGDPDRAEELGEQMAQALRYNGHAPGERLRDPFVTAPGATGPELVVQPLGSFVMGSPTGEKGRSRAEGPQHDVRLARAFAFALSETTVAEFARFVAATEYQTEAERRGRSDVYDLRNGRIVSRRGVNWRHDYIGEPAAEALPVVHVSWNDAKAYVHWLAAQTAKPYRLPTEAEFEYVLRAGTRGRFYWGEDIPPRALENLTGSVDTSPRRGRWTESFKGYGDGHWGPAPVASFPAHPWGLHDLAGNVSEWVEDCWHANYVRAPEDGSAWVNAGCESRVVRGGSWGSAPLDVRSAHRLAVKASARGARVGFRVARDL